MSKTSKIQCMECNAVNHMHVEDYRTICIVVSCINVEDVGDIKIHVICNLQ